MSTESLRKWRDKHLNSISPSFCRLNGTHVSLHLGHGFKNSFIYHYHIQLIVNKLKDNQIHLHNTDFSKREKDDVRR